MSITLYNYQIESIERMKNGCVLCGGVGSGKSRTSIAYYYSSVCNGSIKGLFKKTKNEKPTKLIPLYIITTARKRDTKEWEKELSEFDFPKNLEITIDSWNNIKKYADIKKSFFIFDEQRVVGNGQWVKSFIKITSFNKWILLSATPGDTWSDYIPVFIANGFYKNRTEFLKIHAVFNHYSKFPKIDRYINQGILIKHRNDILITMDYKKKTESVNNIIDCQYDVEKYKLAYVDHWNPFEECPIPNPSLWFYILRKIVNSDPSRLKAVENLLDKHRKIIVFYNFNYELDILKSGNYGDAIVAEWNGQKHEPIPNSDSWVYLVQYTAGAEGWNCIETNVIVFYSQNYSYKVMIQSAGRIDRLNTPFDKLYYYRLKSKSKIDTAIARSLNQKKSFNESGFIRSLENSHKKQGV